MNSVLKALAYGLIFALFTGFLALAAVVRLAPSDPAVWNVPVADGAAAITGACADQVRRVAKGARATCLVRGTPTQVLARLDAIALSVPRTQGLAGNPAQGRMTWVTRTLIMGFPDYITAEAVQAADGTRLDLYSRQRYGNGDWGVNAARLKAWLTTLDQG